MKRTFTFLLMAVLLIGALMMTVSAADFVDGEHTYTYSVSDKNATINGYSGPGGTITLPTSITANDTTYTVTTIGSKAFQNNKNITEIELPATVTNLGSNTFKNCTSLVKVTIPESVTNLGTSTFANCTALKKVIIPGTKLANNGGGKGIFAGCTSLTSFGSLDDANCNIQYGAKRLYRDFFDGMDHLTELVIPASVTDMDGWCFMDCSSLKKVIILADYTNTKISVVGGLIGSPFAGWDGATSAGPIGSGCAIEYAWTKIPRQAFLHCDKLTEVIIPGGNNPNNQTVTSIGPYAFAGCTALTHITIPASVNKVQPGFSLISTNEGDESILCGPFGLWANATSAGPVGSGCAIEFAWTDAIPAYAFAGCTELTELLIPDTVTTLGSWMVAGCDSLEQITVPASINHVDFSKYTAQKTEVVGGKQIKTEKFEVYGSAFSGWPNAKTAGPAGAAEEYNIEWAGSTIPANTFRSLDTLNYIRIPTYVTSIGQRAFTDCTQLKSLGGYNTDSDIEISWSATKTIPNAAFWGANTLTTFDLPDTIAYIGDEAFRNCTGLSGTYNFKTGLVSIGARAFENCTSIKHVNFHKGLSTIGNRAFAECIGLAHVNLPATLTNIGKDIFIGCPDLKTAGPGKELVSVTYGLRKYTAMTDTGADSTSYTYNIEFAWDRIIPANAFHGTDALELIELPQTLIEIGASAMQGCESLEVFNIPAQVTKVGERALSGCTNLELVTIPASVQTMGEAIFEDCPLLISAEPAEEIGIYTSRRISTFSLRSTYNTPRGIIYHWGTEIPANAFSGANFLVPKNIKVNETLTVSPNAFVGIGTYLASGNNLSEKPAPDPAETIMLYTITDTGVTEKEYTIPGTGDQEEDKEDGTIITLDPNAPAVQTANRLNGTTATLPAGSSDAQIDAAIAEVIAQIAGDTAYTYSIYRIGSVCIVSLTIDGLTATATIYIEEQQPQPTTDWGMVLILQQLYNRTFTFPVIATEGGSVTHDAEDGIIKYGRNVTFTITPDEGYTIADVLIDGKSVGAVSEYTFKKVRREHNIVVVFAPIEEVPNEDTAE